MLNDINKTNNTSIKYNIFHKHLTDIIDKHAPLRFLNKNEIAIKAKPWLTRGTLKSIKIRTKYYKNYMQTNDQKWYELYKLYRNKINHLLHLSKNTHYNHYFSKFKCNSKKFWNGINGLISNQKKKKPQQNINLYENGHFITNQDQVANKFNSFFTNIGPKLSSEIEDLGRNFMD